jgi:HK97 family phage major capsid protein
VPFDDVFRLVHSVDVAYRNPATCKFQLSDTNILTLRLAKDGNGRYLWPELGNVQTGQPLQLAGFPVQVNNDAPAMGASAKWASFDDHRYYKIRRINGLTIARINELYIESGQVGFLGFQSADGGFANPGQNPVKLLQNSAS